MAMNRALQREILEMLEDACPEGISREQLIRLRDTYGLKALQAETKYLIGQRFIEDKALVGTGANATWNLDCFCITERGRDFFAGDGGVSATLNVVTVRFHADDLKQILEAYIQASDLAQPDKRRFLDQLRELPGETTKHLVLKLVDLGLQSGPAAIAAIGTYLR